MSEHDLDRSYTALCEALTQVGESRAQVFLSMLCLGLLARQSSAEDVLPLIDTCQRASTLDD